MRVLQIWGHLSKAVFQEVPIDMVRSSVINFKERFNLVFQKGAAYLENI